MTGSLFGPSAGAWTPVLLFVAACWAGAQNALAGGGSFITLPALLLTGMDVRAANITSTVALVPGQLLSGWASRRTAQGAGGVGLGRLAAVSLAGGVAGAALLLVTPTSFFALILPWLVLFATAVFAWGSFLRKQGEAIARLTPRSTLAAQFLIAVYGGYFGGGMGFLMVAALTLAGVAVRPASATKNILAGIINAAAVLVFALSPDLRWLPALVVGAGAMLGGLGGVWLLTRVPERALRMGVVAVGLVLTVGLFLRG